MKINKWIIFTGLKIAELTGLLLFLFICNKIGYFVLVHLMKMDNDGILMNTAFGLAVMIVCFMLIVGICLSGKFIIEKNIEWSKQISERLK